MEKVEKKIVLPLVIQGIINFFVGKYIITKTIEAIEGTRKSQQKEFVTIYLLFAIIPVWRTLEKTQRSYTI
jgi:hypothetical protein